MTAIVLNLNPFIDLSDEQSYQLCQNHRDLKFERTAHQTAYKFYGLTEEEIAIVEGRKH